VFDRRLRTPPTSRLLSTVPEGPVIILTTAEAIQAEGSRAAALTRAGATVVPLDEPGLAAAVRRLPDYGVQSLLIEGGAALHAAAREAGIIDYVQLYVAPLALGAGGIPLDDGAFSTASLFARKVDALGPDVLIEGYVHRPH
jgi:diaminohydroxyphosphoribosylaminopyrimidine deaminase/5-amino-6-(5-phosphoribosylamino)uracil reductase